MGKKLLLFDIDGTLLTTQGVGRHSTREAMLEVFGLAHGVDTHVFGGKTDWLVLLELLSPHGYDEHRIGQHMPVYEQAIGRHISAMIPQFEVKACPGALDVVERLRHDPRYVMGLVTGNVSTTAPVKLRAAGFDPAWFTIGAFGSERLDRNHLSALALERACAHCGETIAPEDVWVIGDTLADIACARAIGAVAVAVCTGHNTRAELAAAQPDYILDDLWELPALLG